MSQEHQPRTSAPDVDNLMPASIRWAGIIAIIQSVIGLGYAVLLIIRQLQGKHDPSLVADAENSNIGWVGYGTALFFIIIFGAVILAAINMMRGRKWGRGPVAMLQMILLLISWFMFQGGAIPLAVATGLSSLLGLIFLFNPRAIAWVADHY
ncbi:hypothetical protein SAMN05660282_00266 [Corynebacterium spheniscorum]|uniref:Uncharacterized protein n=2 Tax=Corynebacterium spheniscorum TaxID=185761 RepID=A0A1I2Q2C3_9CORY|nr:hypothetical protein SAMN05660282_00266 [Corynebacterium spheniscorum]